MTREEVEKESFREKYMKKIIEAKARKAKIVHKEDEVEVDEEAEQMQRLKERLKGKQYTYDRGGNVIVIRAAKAESMPAYRLTPEVGVRDPATESSNRRRGRGSQKKARKGASSKDDKAEKAVHFKQALEVQPPIMETMEVLHGYEEQIN